MKKLLIPFFLLGLLINACKKDDAVAVKPSETPVSTFISGSTTSTITTRSSGPWELGLVFSSSVAGKITQVGSQMPDPGSYRIIIWDNDTKAVLRQKTVEQSAPNTLTMVSIESLALAANKNYVISINSQSGGVNKKYGVVAKTGGGEFMPFNKGSILILNSCYSAVSTPTFPSGTPNVKSEFYGFADFTFTPD
jgi:hypothetical protein